MDRKQQLQELIALNKQSLTQTNSTLSSLEEELKTIEYQESRPPSKKLLQLLEKLRQNPQETAIRKQVTVAALKANTGTFAVWRGGLTNDPDAQYIEVIQPLFNSINKLEQAPTISQHLEAQYIDSLDDFRRILPLNPSGLVSLPTNNCHMFAENVISRDTTQINSLESVYQPLYDTQIVSPTGTAQINFFQVPLGGTSAGSVTPKTQIDTNMDQGGSLPYPKQFSITGISVFPEGATYEDAVKLMSSAWIRLFIGTMDYQVAPVSCAALGIAQKNPLISFKLNTPCGAIYPLPEPIDLIPQQNFRVEVNFPVAQEFSSSFKLKAVLHGSFVRDNKLYSEISEMRNVRRSNPRRRNHFRDLGAEEFLNNS